MTKRQNDKTTKRRIICKRGVKWRGGTGASECEVRDMKAFRASSCMNARNRSLTKTYRSRAELRYSCRLDYRL